MKRICAFIFISLFISAPAYANMTDYCGSGNSISIPPFLSAGASPLVMFVMGRDHKLYYEAYNDATDLDDDGVIDIGYKHNIDYYGYFDSYKCYSYSGSGNNARFNPTRITSDKYCGGSSEWSGNFLNWVSMSRIDVLRKVLFGGYRSTDTATDTVLAGTYIPNDAHSWGKEYAGTDTRLLTPFSPPGTCSLPDSPHSWDRTGNNGILMVRYIDGTNKGCGTAETMIGTFSPLNYSSHSYQNTIWHGQGGTVNHGNLMYVTELNVPSNRSGNWTFAFNSSDGGELEVDGQVVASKYGCGNFNLIDTAITATVNLSAGWHRIIVRVRRDNSGSAIGARLIYRTPGIISTWKNFSNTNLNFYNDGSLRAPNVSTSSDSDICSLKTQDFILSGTPSTGSGYVDLGNAAGQRHLFCVTSINNANVDHSIRVLEDRTERIWQWASVEGSACGTRIDSNADGTVETNVSPLDYYTRVKVCDPSVGLESNCDNYGTDSVKPTGLLQRYGTGSGEPVCSKTNEKPNPNCNNLGFEVPESPMYFGLLTGTYEKNISGGVVRKNIGSIADEINADGTFKSANPANGSIINTLNKLKIDYSGTCGWITDRSINEGECKMWGNPVGEMLWETLKFFAGKAPTAAYNYTSGIDSNLGLPKPNWRSPFEDFPSCSKPNIIIISDVNPSYDDGVPSSGTFENYSLSDLFDEISGAENISGNYFIGSNNAGTSSDFMCSSKSLSNLGQAWGLCPEEPTKRGTYNTAALAYYARTKFDGNTITGVGNLRNIETHAVALASPLPEIKIEAGGRTIQMIPMGKSVSGSGINCGFRYHSTFGVELTGTGFCPSNQIVDFYAESITENSGRFRINFEDVEQGADHDMDAIARYDYVVNPNGTVTVTLTSEYAAGGINQIMGFVITGTTEDGVYIPIRNTDGNVTPTGGSNMPLTWTKTFTPRTSGSAAQLLRDPLWYAAKYGGGSVNNQGEPENYHFITNPLLLEERLDKVFSDILKRGSTGTAPSFDSGKNKGMLINQSMFYPEKEYTASGQTRKITWAGELFTYWFFRGAETQSIYEDSNTNKRLDICDGSSAGGDKIIEFATDENGALRIDRYNSDCTGKRTTMAATNLSLEDVEYIWEGGRKLAAASASSRTIYTNVNGELVPFTAGNAPQFLSDLGSLTDTCLGSANNLIGYIRGTDISGCRPRALPDGSIYKLGDILNSSPVMVDYPNATGRPGYIMTYAGANDGMLHAFRAGRSMTSGLSSYQAVRLANDFNDPSTDKLGREEWAFIPKHALPYLRYLADPDYCHIYYNDLPSYIIEEDTNSDGYIDKRILIGGMRLGGACGAVQAGIKPPADTCSDTSSADCVGLSSYYALDITNQNSPVLLWEFTDRDLGFSFSGPAYIKKNGTRHVMFVSGPTDYAGSADQRLSVFVLTLNSNFTVASTKKYTGENRTGFTRLAALASYTNSFGGKLFTEGIDYGSDGNTDAVFFGVNQYKDGGWTGNVIGVNINVSGGENPDNWVFSSVFNTSYTAAKPVTQKIEHSKCFGMDYIYFGTGRWFYKTDEAGGTNESNYLYGVRIDGCEDGNCNLGANHILASSESVCSELAESTDKFAWRKTMQTRGGDYFMERLLADPLPVSNANFVYFGATEPSSDICAFGARSRMWGLNCAIGSAAGVSCGSGSYEIKINDIPSAVVPRTTGTIMQEKPDGTGWDANSETGSYQMGAIVSDIKLAPDGGSGSKRSGRLLFWIEK